MNKLISLILIYFCLAPVFSQNPAPVNNSVRSELKNNTLDISSSQKTINVEYQIQDNIKIQNLIIRIDSLKCEWSLVSAQKDGEQLWLLNKNSNVQNRSVVNWYRDEDKIIIILPQWESNAVLQFEFLLDFESESAQNDMNLVTEFELNNQIFRAAGFGNGTEIRTE